MIVCATEQPDARPPMTLDRMLKDISGSGPLHSRLARLARMTAGRRSGWMTTMTLLRTSYVAALTTGLVAVVAGCETTASNETQAASPAARSETTITAHAEAAPPAPPLEAFEQAVPVTAMTLQMRPVPGGAVTVQTADGPVEVEVKPFWFSSTEITWDLYDVFVYQQDEEPDPTVDAITRPSRPYVPPDRGFGHDGYATISVAFKGAAAFCEWLSARTGKRFRLPTEAEWQRACDQSGVDLADLDDYAWHDGNADWQPHEVATRKADALGLYDMYGNVREWCTGLDGTPIAAGGCWRDDPADISCATRAVPHPDWQMTDPQVPKSPWWLSDADFMGFRIVCETE